ncbi:MAG TPA: ChaN family lipoprotein [Afifellaceae bacterium]|nr:ChaN family lipoprotein [Afifellaceae bacterium]
MNGPILRTALLAGLVALGAAPAAAETHLPDWTATHYADHPLVGTVWSGDGIAATWSDIERAAAAAEFVLAGEIHPNPDHHRLQARLLQSMVEAGRRPALVFEMIPAAYQVKLDSFAEAAPPDAGGLGNLVDWAKRGWPDWAIYEPIADIALSSGLPIVAGDLDRETIRAIGRTGRSALGEAEQARLALGADLPAGLADTLTGILKESHCNLLPEQAIPAMILVQRARDGAMAAAMTEAKTRGADGAFLVAGAGHVRRDLAVPRVLSQSAPGASVLTVAFIEVDEKASGVAGYGTVGLYDFVVFTPRWELADHCAELAEQMKQRKPAE